MTRRQAPFLVVLVLLVVPSSAQANHLRASVTLSVTPGKVDRSGDQDATAAWKVDCGDPAASYDIQLKKVIEPRNPKRKPRLEDTGAYDDGEGDTTSAVTIDAGQRAHFVIKATCSRTTQDAEGEDVEHTATASATSASFYRPPRFLGWKIVETEYCDIDVPLGKEVRFLQAGHASTLEVSLKYDADSMLMRPRKHKEVVLRIKGGGINRRVRGRRSDVPGVWDYAIGRVKRAGKAKVWMVIGGTPTNKRTIRIRKNC